MRSEMTQEEISYEILRYQKKQYAASCFSALCSFIILLIVVAAAAIAVPRAQELYSTVSAASTNIEKLSAELSDIQFAKTIDNIDQLVLNSERIILDSEDDLQTAFDGVQESLDRLNELDIETLNQSIQDLHTTTQTLAGIFSKLPF